MSIVYNSHTFSKFASVSINEQNLYDSSGRVVIGHRIKMTVKDYVFTGNTVGSCPTDIDDYMEDLRAQLMAVRKSLVVDELGFGKIDLSVIGNETNNGPHPIEFDWQPIGHKKAALISWSVEFTISPCPQITDALTRGVTSFVITQSHSINDKGYASIQRSGFIEVSAFSGNADDYRNFFLLGVYPNCQRTQSWSVSEDQRKISFSIVDRENESPNAYPAGVVSISSPATLSVRLPGQNLATAARVMISCSMELRGDETRLRAWSIWNSILATRLGRIAATTNDYILRDMTVTEDWYTNQYQFSCVVTHYKQNLVQHLGNFSFFAAISQNWALWSQSMAGAQRQRGLSNRRLENPTNQKTSFCEKTQIIFVPDPGQIPFPPLDVIGVLCNPTPTPEKSWIEFEAQLIEAPKIEAMAYTTYGETTINQNPFNPSISNDRKPAFDFQPSGTGYGVKYAQSPSVQRYIWRGKATRIGYPIPPPTKVTLNGVTMKVVGEPRVYNDIVGYQYCQPVYQASWSIGLVYDQTSSPTLREETDPTGLKNDGAPY